MGLSVKEYFGKQPILFILSIRERKGDLLVRTIILLELGHHFFEKANDLEII